jgi:hypothetical protein
MNTKGLSVHPVIPPQVENVFDLGYLGVKKDE